MTKPSPSRMPATPAPPAAERAPDATQTEFRETIAITQGPNATGLSDMTHAAHGLEPVRRADEET